MRPGQQNSNKNRQRGRNNGGRKHMNPLSRNYESNGPDVKVRGNAAHIAEKYVQLARDAHASGDSVMAENYLQHAEHYFRIISAAQQAQQSQGQFRSDQFGQPFDDEADDDFIGDEQADRFEIPQFHQQNQNHQGDRQFDRNRGDGNGQQGDRQGRPDQQPRPDQQQRFEPQRQQPAEAAAESGESQETLTAADASLDSGLETPDSEQGQGEPRRRERRPRRRRPQMAADEGAGIDPNGPQPEVGDLPAFITAGGATNAAE